MMPAIKAEYLAVCNGEKGYALVTARKPPISQAGFNTAPGYLEVHNRWCHISIASYILPTSTKLHSVMVLQKLIVPIVMCTKPEANS